LYWKGKWFLESWSDAIHILATSLLWYFHSAYILQVGGHNKQFSFLFSAIILPSLICFFFLPITLGLYIHSSLPFLFFPASTLSKFPIIGNKKVFDPVLTLQNHGNTSTTASSRYRVKGRGHIFKNKSSYTCII